MRILTVNTGSSSIKAAAYEDRSGPSPAGGDLTRVDQLAVDVSFDPQGQVDEAFAPLLDWIGDRTPAIVGHRIVHGGEKYSNPVTITGGVINDLERLVPIDPTHMPQGLSAIRAMKRAFPDVTQVACFDTAFHRHMPRVARIYALPRPLEDAGVIRYGFHGLSCEFIMGALHEIAPLEAAGRVVIAHLGNGSSMTAVREGTGIDTTMGFSPTGGLVMGTRSGDLDPSVLIYLLQTQHNSPEALNRLVNRQSGLLAVSEISADMRELLEEETKDYRAREAVDLYCYQAAKFLGALAAALGGLDTVVFTAGIGEHAAEVRRRICANLGFLGISIDPDRNRRHDAVISRADDPVTVRVIPTDEDLAVARHTCRFAEPVLAGRQP
jgi:acetate kinase